MTDILDDYPRTTIHADGSVEHTAKIDLKAIPGVICTIMQGEYMNLGLGISFQQSMCVTKGAHAWYRFRLYSSVSKERREQAVRDLLRHIWMSTYPIIWKEDNHGYEITNIGNIIRKWQLVDPKVPF